MRFFLFLLMAVTCQSRAVELSVSAYTEDSEDETVIARSSGAAISVGSGTGHVHYGLTLGTSSDGESYSRTKGQVFSEYRYGQNGGFALGAALGYWKASNNANSGTFSATINGVPAQLPFDPYEEFEATSPYVAPYLSLWKAISSRSRITFSAMGEFARANVHSEYPDTSACIGGLSCLVFSSDPRAKIYRSQDVSNSLEDALNKIIVYSVSLQYEL